MWTAWANTDAYVLWVTRGRTARHLWICAVSLPVRIKAHVSKVEPRLDATVLLAGLVLTAMCPMSPVKWQLHKGESQWISCASTPVIASMWETHTAVSAAWVTLAATVRSSWMSVTPARARMVLPAGIIWVDTSASVCLDTRVSTVNTKWMNASFSPARMEEHA